MIRALSMSAALALLGASCGPAPEPSQDAGPEAGPGCHLTFLGDPAKEPQIEVIALDADMKSGPVMDGGQVALIFPPQGGRVIFAGVRATNVDPCYVQLSGAVRDQTTMQVRVDSRTINLLPGSDGWGSSNPDDISTYSNVPVCPNQWSKTDIYGTKYELEISIVDRGMRQAQAKLEVIPACSEPIRAAECECICRGGYMLGEMCSVPDAGADGGM